MRLFQTPVPTGPVRRREEGSPLRIARDRSSLQRAWKDINQGNGRSDQLSQSVAAISRMATAREPLGAFDSFHPFKIYQLPYEFRTTHSHDDWKKFRVRTGFVEMFRRDDTFHDDFKNRTIYVPVLGTGMDRVYPPESDIYTASFPFNSSIIETLDAFLDPIVLNTSPPQNIFLFYIQLSTDETAPPTATLKVSGINGDTTHWATGENAGQPLLVKFGNTNSLDNTQIPIGFVEFANTGNVFPPGYFPTGDPNITSFRIVQAINHNLIDRFPDTQMRFVEPSAGAGTIEWSADIQYYRGDVVTVTSGGSATTWLAMDNVINALDGTPATPSWIKLGDYTP